MGKRINITLSVLCLALLAAQVVIAATPVTVTVIAETRDESIKWQTEMKKQFEAANPHITVDLVSTAGTGLVPKMQTMLAGGVPLDIGYMDPYLIIDWGLQGILEDLTPFVAKEQRQFREWYPVALDLYRVRGGLYGLPQDLQIGAVYYNKDLFNKAGVPYPRVGWTYDELRATALRLTRQTGEGVATMHGYRVPTGRNYMSIIWSYGGDLVDDWAEPTRFTGRTSEVANALQYLADLVASGAAQDKASHDKAAIQNTFMGQAAAMIQTNTVIMARGFQNITAFDWDIMPLPQGPSGHVPYINAIGWFVFSSSKCKTEAFDFLRFMTSNEALEQRVQMTGLIPPSMRVFQTTWLSGRSHPANRHLLLESFDKARSPWQMQADAYGILNREILATIWGTQAPASAIEQMESQLNAFLKSRP